MKYIFNVCLQLGQTETLRSISHGQCHFGSLISFDLWAVSLEYVHFINFHYICSQYGLK